MRRVLLVDSSAHTRSLLTAILGRLRYAVTAVETGGDAIASVCSDADPPANAVVVVLRRADPTVAGLCAFLSREWSLPVVAITAFAEGDVPPCSATVHLG